ncbi:MULTISPECIES: putative toxin-antitoxin system toxin component, PIN family [Pseudanabaena]|uniref:putative toxin-antitoxin system toxin component, PIN family n=1 Tax=Pseudanabaena TaxID=1152 RepID=UPI0024784960|nr:MULTISPECIES: putative toxin-antitoxin system toxin component, PIN family [Pseudanabaena]MEA5489825.1 putative toxin-antitoxin system toxin component, PIN family [Pseudanabaena sp. CCNP1317]WGS71041.1 putative toxin-antitoxin system toxin component, PIN family [Pseudanabaena galeata CCNP1313]
MTNSSIRLVLDTNVLVSAILSPASISAKILNWGEDNGVILYSTATLTEVLSVLGRSKFSKYIDRDDIDGLSIRIKTVWLFVEILNQVQLCRDPKDDKFIDLALNGEASYLITGDSDLLVLKPIQNTSVINPRTFWDEIIKI